MQAGTTPTSGLDADSCWRACRASDTRFDGRFFIAVRTTGIYCRPVCPAPMPKRQNVTFFPTASAAAQAGFRPCLRCRPESAPGAAGWAGTTSTVRRALRLIEGGALLRGGVEALAAELGMGARQLRRLFAQHVGASPLAVAHTQRLQFAKKLVDETRLPMTEIAGAAGYASVRRFNDSVLKVYGRSPRDLRRLGEETDRPVAAGDLVLKLAFRGALDWSGMLDYLGPRATRGVEHVGHVERGERGERNSGTYARTLRFGRARGLLHATVPPGRQYLELRLHLPSADRLFEVVRTARRVFDLDADPASIVEHLAENPVIGPLVRACPGRRVPGAWEPFELAVRAVLGQQVSVKGATTLAGRLVDNWGDPLPATMRESSAALTHTFPVPRKLIAADLRSIGLPRERAETIRRLAVAYDTRGELAAPDGRRPAGLGNLDDLVARLTAIAGIGDWTAQYVALRGYGEPDAFPAGDLGLRKAVAVDGVMPSTAQLRSMSEAWRPWRAAAVMHLWASL